MDTLEKKALLKNPSELFGFVLVTLIVTILSITGGLESPAKGLHRLKYNNGVPKGKASKMPNLFQEYSCKMRIFGKIEKLQNIFWVYVFLSLFTATALLFKRTRVENYYGGKRLRVLFQFNTAEEYYDGGVAPLCLYTGKEEQ